MPYALRSRDLEMAPEAAAKSPGRQGAPWRLTAAICLALAVLHTWPLATAPATLSRNDNADTLLNEWILAWVAHELPRAPARLFDTNIFYPARDTLAYSEPLIVPAIMGAPLRWMGGSPVLVFNVVLLLGFALTAWAGASLVGSWTRDRYAGLLAGSMLAFNAHALTHLPHLQSIHAWGLPMALLAADRLMCRRRTSDALRLALWLALMAYTSGYLTVFGLVMVAVAVVARTPAWLNRARAIVPRLVLAGGVAAVAMLPVYLPYRRVAIERGMLRSLEDVAWYSSTLGDYLATGSRLHYAIWSHRFYHDAVAAFFPGFVVIGLAGFCVWRTAMGEHRHRERVIMLLAIALAGVVLSIGTRTPIYHWLYGAFPPVRGLRVAARFGLLFVLGISALAGLGLAALRARVGGRAAVALGVALLAAANLEALRAPFTYTRFTHIPGIYGRLASEPGPVVLVEVPFYPPQAAFENAIYELASTAHWRPLMNGYSGYVPRSYREVAPAFWLFPQEVAIDAMRRAGVTHVVVHSTRFGQDPNRVMEQVAASGRLEQIAIGPEGLALYRLTR